MHVHASGLQLQLVLTVMPTLPHMASQYAMQSKDEALLPEFPDWLFDSEREALLPWLAALLAEEACRPQLGVNPIPLMLMVKSPLRPESGVVQSLNGYPAILTSYVPGGMFLHW
jgi:hypothetical protein